MPDIIGEKIDDLKKKVAMNDYSSKLYQVICKLETNENFQDSRIKIVEKDIQYLSENQKRIEQSQEKLHIKVDDHGKILSTLIETTKNIDSAVSSFIEKHEKDAPKAMNLIRWGLLIIITLIISTIGYQFSRDDKFDCRIDKYQEKIIEMLGKK